MAEKLLVSDARSETEITLGLLTAVEEDSRVTQRSMANDLGIALGLANAYLKRCIKKGLIKVQQVPANRYTYYLTPQGFAEKGRLTAEYLSQGFKFFRLAREELDQIFARCEQIGWRRVGIHGLTDLTEIAVMSAAQRVMLPGIIDSATTRLTYGSIPIIRSIVELGEVDAILIADLDNGQAGYEEVAREFSPERILVPPLLNVSRRDPSAEAIQ